MHNAQNGPVTESSRSADNGFLSWMAAELGDLDGVQAVCLGGSRAAGTHRPDSDWDLALYYRGSFNPDQVRAKGWPGQVFDVGAWGGGVMNGGAWLEIDGRRVDIHYRDLDKVEHWCAEAEEGRFAIEQLLFYVAGIPTYVVMGELALNQTLVGQLPVPAYPATLALSASQRWSGDATASLSYALAALTHSNDVTVALANGSRAILQAAHSRLAERKEWALNEKGLAQRAGLHELATRMLGAARPEELTRALEQLLGEISAT